MHQVSLEAPWLNRVTHSTKKPLATYLGPIVVLFVIIGLALLYWAPREPGRDLDDTTLNPSIGTTGGR